MDIHRPAALWARLLIHVLEAATGSPSTVGALSFDAHGGDLTQLAGILSPVARPTPEQPDLTGPF